MLLTGNYLYQKWKNKAGIPYTTYFDPAKWNKMFEEALFQSIEAGYKNPQDQLEKDEMAQFISTNVMVTNIGGNSLNLRPIAITTLTNVGTAWTLSTNIPFAPQAFPALIDIQGVTGFTTNPNGSWVVTSFGSSVKGFLSVFFTAPTSVGGPYNMNSGYFSFQNNGNLVANQLIDYLHLLNVKCQFTKPLNAPVVLSSTIGSPLTVILDFPNNLKSSSLKNPPMITMSGWLSNTVANGSFYIKKIDQRNFQLYQDIFLQNPVVGIANETATNVTLGLTYYNSARPYLSTEAISSQNTPSEKSPRYKVGNGRITFYGDEFLLIPCTEITVDYICNPKLPYVFSGANDIYSGTYVDANDTAFDCTTIYSEKLLYTTLDRMSLIASGSTRDSELSQISLEQLKDN